MTYADDSARLAGLLRDLVKALEEAGVDPSGPSTARHLMDNARAAARKLDPETVPVESTASTDRCRSYGAPLPKGAGRCRASGQNRALSSASVMGVTGRRGVWSRRRVAVTAAWSVSRCSRVSWR
ncbi:hypothetical protein DFJ69_6310 [Thermomonospora umbrina]|uniref:Uncharacterized protein n=1 Tax=Thermomonospora umbrina TaxID=111806 RepID=A0A3D9T2Y5_9ACTN|nr:hypothetical protein DFJ69_6310 [Thermomonospora umbrina]